MDLLTYYLLGIILLPAIIYAAIAQAKVHSAFKKYSQVLNRRGVTAIDLTRKLLDQNDLREIAIVQSPGHLSDHYHPKKKQVGLSGEVYNSTSIAALGIAAHEVGHAIQYKEGYWPIKVRSALVPILKLTSWMMWPLIIVGIVLLSIESVAGPTVMWVGVGLFSLTTLFSLITLPSEFNASKRALHLLSTTLSLDDEELRGARKVLSAAAQTYVAALLVSVLSLLRIIIVILMSRR